MPEGEEKRGGEEIRSPLQVVIRVLLALLVVAVLLGLILAVILRPERVVEPAEEAAELRTSFVVVAAVQPPGSKTSHSQG